MKTIKNKSKFVKGTIFIFPTETAYGIGCDSRDAVAVKRIFDLKKRAPNKTVPLIAADISMVKKYVLPSVFRDKKILSIIKKYWPGPLTLVLPIVKSARKVFAPGIIASDNTIAIRVSSHPLARLISLIIGAPIVATSANRAGASECYAAENAAQLLNFENAPAPKLIFDSGRLQRRKPSTIVRFRNGKFEILRRGKLDFKNVVEKLRARAAEIDRHIRV